MNVPSWVEMSICLLLESDRVWECERMLHRLCALGSGEKRERENERYHAFYLVRESHPGRMASFFLIGRNLPLKFQQPNNSRIRQWIWKYKITTWYNGGLTHNCKLVLSATEGFSSDTFHFRCSSPFNDFHTFKTGHFDDPFELGIKKKVTRTIFRWIEKLSKYSDFPFDQELPNIQPNQSRQYIIAHQYSKKTNITFTNSQSNLYLHIRHRTLHLFLYNDIFVTWWVGESNRFINQIRFDRNGF